MTQIHKQIIALFSACVVLVVVLSAIGADAKLLSRQRFYEDPYSMNGPYSMGPMATGERAIITVRGARNPYDGSVPSKIAIADDPYRGPYPRGIYDNAGMLPNRMPYGGLAGRYPMGGYPMASGYPYGGSMYGPPGRIAVTQAIPLPPRYF